MAKPSKTAVNPALASLMAASRAARSGEESEALSPKIAACLGPDAEPLEMQWETDRRKPKRRPALYAMPTIGTHDEECERFAKAVAVLTDGTFESVQDTDGTVTFVAHAHRAGVDVELELVVWGYDNPAKYARRLPGLIKHYRST